MSRYVDEFLSLRCAGDVLNVVNPIGNSTAKEISESIGVIKRLKKIVLKEPMRYTLYDLCAGNAITSVLAVHLFPIKEAFAIDKRPRKRKWHLAKRFKYLTLDINDVQPDMFDENSIIIGIHACTSLANRIIELYKESKAQHLILMPCCIGQLKHNYPDIVREKLGKYIIWAWQLAEKCDGKFTIDNHVLSPVNAIITASKKGG